jgi:enoyl-[acyl-carrier-protein] reductase (NADH)
METEAFAGSTHLWVHLVSARLVPWLPVVPIALLGVLPHAAVQPRVPVALEVAPFGVRVNAVAPGVIETPFHARYSTKEQLEAAVRSIPLGRLGTPEDCVGAFEFLADERMSGYITGQIIEVNGGQLMP